MYGRIILAILLVGATIVGCTNDSGPMQTNPPPGSSCECDTVFASKDNTLYEQSDTLSNGRGWYVFVGRTGEGVKRRAPIFFDIASVVAAGATIDSVMLELFLSRTDTGRFVVRLHPLLTDWGEADSDAIDQEGSGAPAQLGDATWTHTFFDTDFWATPGGDFQATASGSLSVNRDDLFYLLPSTPAMVADVQSWLDSPTTNFGWMLIGDESQSKTTKRFDSSNFPQASRRPKLLVYSTEP